MLGCNMEEIVKEFIMQCAIHTDHLIESYCHRHDSVCCYECTISAHGPCTFVPIGEVVDRKIDGMYADSVVVELREIQNRVLDTIRDIDNDKADGQDQKTQERTLKLSQNENNSTEQSSNGNIALKMKMRMLSREVEDMINVSIQSFKYYVESDCEVTSFVAYMKNRHRLIRLKNDLSNLIGSQIDDAQRGQKEGSLQRFQINLDYLLALLEDFERALKRAVSRYKSVPRVGEAQSSSTVPQSTTHNKETVIQEGGATENVKACDIRDSGEKIPANRETKQCPSEIEKDTCINSLVKVETQSLKTNTKPGNIMNHRIIRHRDINLYLSNEEQESETIAGQSTLNSIDIEKDTDVMDTSDANLIELRPIEGIDHEQSDTSRENTCLDDTSDHKQQYTATSTTPFKFQDRGGATHDNKIVCDVMPKELFVYSGQDLPKHPLRREIQLSTNRIPTKESNPPGFHAQAIQVQQMLELQFTNELCVRLPDDEYSCDVVDVACMPDGRIVVCDLNNSRLKLFDCYGQSATQSLCTQFPPYRAVSVSNSLLMFAHGQARNHLSLVRVTSALHVLQDFTTKHACVALATNNSFIYVVCQERSRVEVHILNTEGVVNMKMDIGDHVTAPRYLAVDPITEMVYVTDDSSGVFGIDRTGRKIVSITDSAILGYAGIATDTSGNVFVCTEFPDGVYAKPRDKNYLRPILLGQEGEQVCGLCFNEINNSLVVSLKESDSIRQYKIKSD